MTRRLVWLFLPLLLLAAPMAAGAGGHYVPRAGDGFHFSQNIELGGGIGTYTGYSESTFVNGTTTVTAVQSNGTETASYVHSGSYRNSTGSSSMWTVSGSFTFSANTFRYVQGTDNQTGYTNPYVWFYVDNTLAPGAPFFLLNSALTVVSTNNNYLLAGSPSRYVATLYGEGTGSFQRNDVYGVFTATYTWMANFDPSTGYIVGYFYTEQDRDSTGNNGFTMTDLLYVTSTTYALTAGTPPSSSPNPSGATLLLIAGGAIAGVVVVGVIVLLVTRSRRRTGVLPKHSAQGSPGYGPPPGVPPPVNLTPSAQPAVQQIVLRETVKVNCRFCGTLIDSTATVCPQCGAPRT